jgi:TrmH family RNA methyltransferase
VNDPGNLGTLLRTAAWFGFPALYCSSGTVDCYNPKVVRSSMGGLFRVGVVYLEDFSAFVCYHSNQIAAAAPGGLAPETGVFRQRPMLLMGNESHGLPSELLNPPKLQRVTIGGAGGVESLNVSTAGSILAHQLYVQRT